MKKLMSLVIAVLFAFGMTAISFAADAPAPATDKAPKADEKKADEKKPAKKKKAKKAKKMEEKKDDMKKDDTMKK